MSTSRDAFEAWYVCAAFDYERDPIGSQRCGLQWEAWQAGRRAALEETQPLREAAQEVVYRWDTPLWKSAEATAVFISRLRRALASGTKEGQEPC